MLHYTWNPEPPLLLLLQQLSRHTRRLIVPSWPHDRYESIPTSYYISSDPECHGASLPTVAYLLPFTVTYVRPFPLKACRSFFSWLGSP